MSPVLGKKTLQELRQVVADAASDGALACATRDRLVAELDFALKTKKSVKAARVRRVAKKKTKREEMAELRAEVFARSGYLCEVCGAEATDLEHAFGRTRVKQAPSNCLAMCRPCHVAKTNYRPTSSHWWGVYTSIFAGRGDMRESEMAAALDAKRAAQGRTGEQT